MIVYPITFLIHVSPLNKIEPVCLRPHKYVIKDALAPRINGLSMWGKLPHIGEIVVELNLPSFVQRYIIRYLTYLHSSGYIILQENDAAYDAKEHRLVKSH